MSIVRFISDLHFGHKLAAEKRGFSSIEEHDKWIIDRWNTAVNKRDLTWILGDVAFHRDALKNVKKLNGVKHLILGNHDEYALALYLEYFNKVHGFMKYKGFWLSHPPIDRGSLRGRYNIHGHTHQSTIEGALGNRYVCVCVEALNGIPIKLDTIKKITNGDINV